MTDKPIVSKRNHLSSLQQMVDDVMPSIMKAGSEIGSVRSALERYTRIIIRSVQFDFTKGAERGMEQVARLIEDPDYYETVSNRRGAYRRKMKEQDEAQKLERWELANCPTQEQISAQIKNLEHWIAYRESELNKDRQKLDTLRGKLPHNKAREIRALQ